MSLRQDAVEKPVIKTTESVLAELAPTGQVRAAINVGNLALAQRNPETGELGGLSVDLAREIGRHLDRPVVLVPFESAGAVFAAVEANVWDLAFLAIEASRAQSVLYSPPILTLEASYLVPGDSELHDTQQLDRSGIRIASVNKAAYDLFLGRTLQHAELVRAPTPPDALACFLQDRLDALAGIRPTLERYARDNPGLRLLPDSFLKIEQAVAVPRGRVAAAAFVGVVVAEFVARREQLR